tara:strand:+ start:10406 stop:11248 length:843 start_codon:yes stop_codon:yes gene_type:complete
MKIYDLTISIVLYNTELEEIINIIKKFENASIKYKIFLIDNSPLNTLSNKIGNIENVQYIFIGKNVGFGSGHNIGIKISKDISKYHLVLNADVDFQFSIIPTIIKYMDDNSEVGLLAPKILNFDGTIQYSAKLLPTPLNLIVRRFIPINFLLNKLDYRYELKFFNFDKIIQVPYVMGCFMFMRCKIFENIDGFDERFFMYPEDIDLTRRIYQKHKTIYFPLVSIMHKHGKGSYKNYKLLYYHVSSMIKYFNKWGWIFDKERKQINAKVLSQFNSIDRKLE